MAENKSLYSRYNTDDVFNRIVIVGLLNLLNNKITYEQIWDDNVVETVNVPCMYDFGSSDERFAQDNYTFFGEACFGKKKIDGKFDMLPRIALKYTGSHIDAGNMTNKYVKGTYLKNENGKLTSYTSFLESIPLSFTFDCECWVDNIITAFKIEQSIRETFYKNRTFNVLYRGMKLGCCVGFPEQHNLEKTVSYSFDSERQLKLSFSLAVEAYQPCFNSGINIESSKRIEHIAYDVTTMPAEDIIQSIKFKSIDTSKPIPAGSNLYIEWDSYSNVSDMCTVILEYIDENGISHVINDPLYNNHGYLWRVPSMFAMNNIPTITFNEPDLILEKPEISIIPNLNTKAIDENSFVLLSQGLFNFDNGTISFTVEYMNENDEIQLSGSYILNVANRKVNEEHPVTVVGDPLIYTNKITPKQISLKISYPLNTSVYDKIDNLMII